ncbi:glycosyltransferase [Thioclava sp. GXIMD4215]|uniref:glycosyltransferase family 2 protein n=1 Tax=Thioclava sp. GXIMD4215 TaxID=3131928 RepID=UPI00311ACE98
MPERFAAIVIGRNEGERLLRCLASLEGAMPLIYVDSGSTDGSREAARARGVEVVELDLTKPFTAARARNAGLERLRAIAPDAAFVQLVDGDCEIRSTWIETARSFLETRPEVAVVCGRRRERFPEATPYNAHCDREWDTPVGEARACGGDALMRVQALSEVGDYNPTLIAGEEPEMCVRLRKAGWKIWRIDAEMTWHDAAMTRFGQFWKRARRAGHAYAEGAYLHGAAPYHHNVAQTRRALLWGLYLPLALLLGALLLSPWILLGFLIYPVQILRLARKETARYGSLRTALEHAAFLTIGKLPEAIGICEFHLRRLTGKRAGIMEYK